MYAIESLGKAASYAAAPPMQAQTPAKPGTTTQSGAPTVSVSSASRSFSGYGDLILSSASSTGSEKAATADGDEGANGREVNDGDADDAPLASPSVSFSDAGTYSVSVYA